MSTQAVASAGAITQDGPDDKVDVVERIFFVLVTLWLLVYTFVVLFAETLLLPKYEVDWCRPAQMGYPNIITYPNPYANNNPCYIERTTYLLGMNQLECDFARRMIAAMVLGAIVGYERKVADRAAGIRTLSLVCLGACFFTYCGQFAFRSSMQIWDSSRVSAQIPSGVGFLGGALIFKQEGEVGEDGRQKHSVHGLTTAASLWLSASIGVQTGGGMFATAAYAVALVLCLLRFAPRLKDDDDDDDGENMGQEGDALPKDKGPKFAS